MCRGRGICRFMETRPNYDQLGKYSTSAHLMHGHRLRVAPQILKKRPSHFLAVAGLFGSPTAQNFLGVSKLETVPIITTLIS